MVRRAVDPVLTWWRALGILTQDGIFALVLAALAFAPGLIDNGTDLAEFPHRPLDALGIALGLAQCLPLVLRRTAPLPCLALVVAAFVTDQLLAYPPGFGSEGLLVVLYTAGAYLTARWLLVAGLAVYVAFCVVLHGMGSPEQPAQYVTFFLMTVVCWAAGRWMRSWRAGVEARRVHSAELAVAEERARIARELHDVVTHHVTAMVVQSDAAQFLIPTAPDRAVDGLVAIGDTGRRALAELRTLLDVLDGARSTPVSTSTDTIDELVDQVRSAGQPVEFTQRGDRPSDTPDGVALAVYRVVQEALTNAVKHAPGHRTVVRLHYAEDDITVSVHNDLAAGRSRTADLGGGRGLTGLRARVAAVGGSLSASRDADGFEVRACLPLR
ncbi:sensor histidine kinase [Kutzneria sp. 744]|uniref:sensor histidine kinase n=1 Tax=Kutzneria sp. (strain 744) TaxID=345341 RepID=UPI0003EEA3CE|nr:histidine kinase [Kutzneria sp. 744]EWM13995.1 two-component system sensor kinase [Kutzneria sp. 744]